MADKKISQLTALTTQASADELVIVDSSATQTKKITVNNLFQGIPVSGGIGTSSPQQALHVASSGSARIQIQDTDTTKASASSLIEFNGSDGRSAFMGVASGAFTTDLEAGSRIVWALSGSEKARIDSSGNLLVGKTSGSFGTAGSALYSSGLAQHTRDGASVLQLNRLSSDGIIQTFNKDGNTIGSVGSFAGDMIIGLGDHKLRFFDGSNAISPCVDAGTINDNAISLGVANSRFKDLYLSGGAYLGGTATANKLDDYEEGTWTPVIADASTGGNTGTATTAVGSYTKVGRQVTVNVRIDDLDTTGMTGANSLFIRGLPFTAGSGTPGQSQGSARLDSFNLNDDCVSVVSSTTSSNSHLTLRQTVDNAADTNVKIQNVTSGSADVFATITYFVS